jgi:ABC-type nickel/cobalt efflux system permease component RcnA
LANNIITKDENVKSIEEPTLEEKLTVEEKKKELTFLEKYTKEIKRYLIEIEKGEDKLALVFLLFASFIYGVIHALGPGHGKALAFSYFSAQKSSFIQAFSISLATAFVHIIGAFILVVVSVFVLQSVLNSFIEDSISYLTSLCAVLIMILSLYILYKKLKKKSCACCKRKNQDLLFVLTAGLIPCPGTVLLFVYAFILKTYLSVILASIAISLGMAIVIFASSFLGLSLNKFSRKSHSFTNALEIFAPIFMFFLGLLLLLSAV